MDDHGLSLSRYERELIAEYEREFEVDRQPSLRSRVLEYVVRGLAGVGTVWGCPTICLSPRDRFAGSPPRSARRFRRSTTTA